MLTFDPIKHEYREDGVKLPSVTQILEKNGLFEFMEFVNPDQLERSRLRGTAVHRGSELMDAGTLDESTIDPEIRGYLYCYQEACKTIRADYGFWLKDAVREQQYRSKKYKYAGTPDRVFLDLKKLVGVVLDVKTGVKNVAAALQTAAYQQMAEELYETRMRKWIRLGLYLHPRAPAKIIPFKATTDFAMFLSCFNVWKLRTGKYAY